MKNALIIFVRNPELGKVKTRLASTIGNQKALDIYIKLLQHTKAVAAASESDKYVFATGQINELEWKAFNIEQQSGESLGDKMLHAFGFLFQQNYKNVVIIGSDCLEITNDHLAEAFSRLEDHDVVIGPANDGGYYLLGMKQAHSEIFLNKTWGSALVLTETIETIKKQHLSFYLMEKLTDIDEEKDLPGYFKNERFTPS